MLNHFKKTSILIGIAIIIIVTFAVFSDKIGHLFYKEEIKISQENVQQVIEEKVTLIIDNGEETPKNIEVKFQEGMTAFDLLKNEIEKADIVLKTKTYDIGIFIEVIGDKENGEDGKYWMYYVNEEMPMVAADKKEIEPGDKVEFKFEKSSF